jgi:hypothetical protein
VAWVAYAIVVAVLVWPRVSKLRGGRGGDDDHHDAGTKAEVAA